MSKIAISGASTGSATFTIESPATSTNRTLTLPDNTGTILTNATTTGFPAGSVLQVVSTTPDLAQVATSSTSFVTSGLSQAITPTSASSKIFVICTYSAAVNSGRSNLLTLYRGATDLAPDSGGLGRLYTQSGGDTWAQGCIMYLDSPATTSSTTYALYFRAEGAYTVDLFAGSFVAPTLTLMEIAA